MAHPRTLASCNKMLGFARDKLERLRAAVAYLLQHGKQKAV